MNEFLDKEQIYKEKLLYLTIRGSMYRLDKSMQTISVLMTNDSSKGRFFSDNDYDLIIDCCLRELESKNTARTRTQILKVLNLILDHPTWMAKNKHRLGEINTKIEMIIIHEDETSEFTVKEREQIMRLNMRLV